MADGGFSARCEDTEKIKKNREKIDELIVDDSDILEGTLSIRFA
jgi:hypothetical protein